MTGQRQTRGYVSGVSRYRRTLILGVTCLARFIVILDGTTAMVALPTIRRELGFQPDSLTWVVNSYLLLFGGLLLLGGRCADFFGSRRTLAAGAILFTSSSLVSGMAVTQAVLIGSRAVQGLAAAFIAPAALSILASSFPEGPERRGALSAWGAVGGFASSAGLILGGLLTDLFSWHAIFILNVPVGLVLVVGAVRVVPGGLGGGEARFNLAGTACSTVGVVALVYAAMCVRQHGWEAPVTVGSVLMAAASLAAALLLAVVRLRSRLLVSVRQVREILVANSAMFIAAGPAVVVLYFTTTFMQEVLGYSPLQSGSAFVPAALALLTGSAFTHRMNSWLGSRRVLLVGLVMLASGLTWLTRLNLNSEYLPDILPAIVISFAGIGFVFVNCTIHATTDGTGIASGTASGLINATQQVGTAVWLAILTSLAATGVVVQAGGEPVNAITVKGYHSAFWLAVLLTICAAAVVFTLFGSGRDAAAPKL
jgi:MFS family permease